MDWLFRALEAADVSAWEVAAGEWILLITVVLLAIEFVRYAIQKRLNWSLVGDVITNFATQILFFATTFLLVAALYLGVYYAVAEVAVFEIPINLATVAICIVLADFAYYWEHRFTHRVNLAWATHSAHHSSPFFNVSVAYRFGPLDAFWPIFFHVPLVLIGFDPLVVLSCEVIVQLYQTVLHTETAKRLPKPIEWLFNTPSHHRVHHGSNEKYIDTNYGGIFIIWDRMFGTFVEEDEPVVYGLVSPIPEIDSPMRMLAAPFVAFFHGFWRLGRKLKSCRTAGDVWMSLFGPPDWRPEAPLATTAR